MSDEELEQDGGHGFEDMQFIDADGNRIDLSQLSPEQIMELQVQYGNLPAVIISDRPSAG